MGNLRTPPLTSRGRLRDLQAARNRAGGPGRGQRPASAACVWLPRSFVEGFPCSRVTPALAVFEARLVRRIHGGAHDQGTGQAESNQGGQGTRFEPLIQANRGKEREHKQGNPTLKPGARSPNPAPKPESGLRENGDGQDKLVADPHSPIQSGHRLAKNHGAVPHSAAARHRLDTPATEYTGREEE